jgi:hypothetical protein
MLFWMFQTNQEWLMFDVTTISQPMDNEITLCGKMYWTQTGLSIKREKSLSSGSFKFKKYVYYF